MSCWAAVAQPHTARVRLFRASTLNGHADDDDQDCVPLHKYEWCQVGSGSRAHRGHMGAWEEALGDPSADRPQMTILSASRARLMRRRRPPRERKFF